MSVHKCSLCNRPAVWLICDELFCEVDKEKIVNRFGIDVFSMKRLSENEKDFIIRGKHKKPLSIASFVSEKIRKTTAR